MVFWWGGGVCEELPLQGTSEVACGPGRGEGEPSWVSWRVDERGLSSAGLLGEQAPCYSQLCATVWLWNPDLLLRTGTPES